MKVVNYIHMEPQTKAVPEGSKEMLQALEEGWKVIRYDSIEERYMMGKASYVIVEVINDDLNLEALELRDIIISACGAKHLTRAITRKFFEEIATGKRELTKEKEQIRSYVL